MAIYNTASDAANTAVRAFLTKVGEFYLGRTFNTGTGRGRSDWERIRDTVFGGKCAYCGESGGPLQMEHLFMFNRNEYGLHHPGNIVPCCRQCNKRQRRDDNSFANWKEHLKAVCERQGNSGKFSSRKDKIEKSMSDEGYPNLDLNEQNAVRVIAGYLYENIKNETSKSLELYKQLDEAFVDR